MKRKAIVRIAAFVMVMFAVLTGCNNQQPQESQQSAEAAYTEVRNRFLAQEGYAFHGRTKLLAGDTANGNLVNFSGQKQGKELFMNVKLSFPEQKRVDSMSLFAQGERLYAKFDDREPWQPVNSGTFSLQQELNNWSPEFNFEQMEEMRTRVVPLEDKVPNDQIAAFRVLLDSNKLKSWLAQQMKNQVGGQIQTLYNPKLKLAMKLSDEEMSELKQGARVQAAQTMREIDEIIDHMELEAEYTVYYDTKQMLPTGMVMNIRSEYDLDDQRVFEHSQIETFLRNYGRQPSMPRPGQ